MVLLSIICILPWWRSNHIAAGSPTSLPFPITTMFLLPMKTLCLNKISFIAPMTGGRIVELPFLNNSNASWDSTSTSCDTGMLFKTVVLSMWSGSGSCMMIPPFLSLRLCIFFMISSVVMSSFNACSVTVIPIAEPNFFFCWMNFWVTGFSPIEMMKSSGFSFVALISCFNFS